MHRHIFHVALLAFCWTNAALILDGPEGPVMEGDFVMLKCISDPEADMNQVYFEKFSKDFLKWLRLDPYEAPMYRRCFYYMDLDLNREPGSLVLTIPNIQTWSEGRYRCVSQNSSNIYNSSSPFSLSVNYMRDISICQEGVGSFSRYFSSLQELSVKSGKNVVLECSASASETPQYTWTKEGEDWLEVSSKLKLKNVMVDDTGRYTCTAQHPSLSKLFKKRTIAITVSPEDASWYSSPQSSLFMMTTAAGSVALLFALSVSICFCRQAQGKQTKGPIDDHSKKKPFYTSSLESLNYVDGDSQPLV